MTKFKDDVKFTDDAIRGGVQSKLPKSDKIVSCSIERGRGRDRFVAVAVAVAVADGFERVSLGSIG